MIYFFLELLPQFFTFTCLLSRHPNRAFWGFPSCSSSSLFSSRQFPPHGLAPPPPCRPYPLVFPFRFFFHSSSSPSSSEVPLCLPPRLLSPHCLIGSHPQGPTSVCGSTLGVALEPWTVGARGGREEGREAQPSQVSSLGKRLLSDFSLLWVTSTQVSLCH